MHSTIGKRRKAFTEDCPPLMPGEYHRRERQSRGSKEDVRYKVVLTEPALSDITAIYDYIALESEEAAERLVDRLLNSVDRSN